MKIRGLKSRLYRVEDKVMVSDGIVFAKGFSSATNPIKDSFKLYIKRW